MMKNFLKTVLYITLLVSCDPDVPNEGITFEPIDFSFIVKNDTVVQSLGNPIIFSSKELNHNELNGGELKIFMSIYYFNVDTIRKAEDAQRAYEHDHYNIIFNSGTYVNHSNGFIREVILYPKGEDSLYFDFELTPLKTGIYKFVFRSSFYEGPDGKARTNARFDVISPHWEFYDSSLGETPYPSDDSYFRSLLFRVE